MKSAWDEGITCAASVRPASASASTSAGACHDRSPSGVPLVFRRTDEEVRGRKYRPSPTTLLRESAYLTHPIFHMNRRRDRNACAIMLVGRS